MALRRFTKIADDLTEIGGTAVDTAKRANLTRISKSLDDAGGDLSKVDFAKVIKSSDDVTAFGAIIKKTDIPPSARKKLVNELSKWVKVGGDVPKAAGVSVGAAGKAMEAVSGFFKRNEKTLMLAGITAAAIATLMLFTGETDPGKAIGGLIGDVAESAGEGIGGGLKAGVGGAIEGIDEGLGISDFFSKWGIYIGIFCAVLIIFGLIMMLK